MTKDTAGLVDAAYAFLRSHTTGDLRFDEHLRPIKYVIAPDGKLVAPAMVAMLQALDTVLFVPEYAEGAMEVQVTLEEFDENAPRDDDTPAWASPGALADRWRIHHGDPPDVRWALLHVDAARYGSVVIDGDGLERANPLAPDEPALCRAMNREHADDLRDLCAHAAGIEIERGIMVAVDPLGIDVRGRFDVIRVPAPSPMPDAAAVRATLAALCDEARAARG